MQNEHDIKFQDIHPLRDEFVMQSWLKLILTSQASPEVHYLTRFSIPYVPPKRTMVNLSVHQWCVIQMNLCRESEGVDFKTGLLVIEQPSWVNKTFDLRANQPYNVIGRLASHCFFPLLRCMFLWDCSRWRKVLFLWYFSVIRFFCSAIIMLLELDDSGANGTETEFVSWCFFPEVGAECENFDT